MTRERSTELYVGRISQSGFSLTEILIALGCTSFLIAAVTSLAGLAFSEDLVVRAKQDAIEQRSEIRDVLLKAPQASGASSCLSRLGLTGSEVFRPGTDFELPVANFANSNPKIVTNRIYLSKDSFLGVSGVNSQYSVQLIIEQSIRDNLFSRQLQPSILGLMNISVNSSGQIIACNWDAQSLDAAEVCDNTSGVSTGGSAGNIQCNSQPTMPVLGSCPGGTTMNLVESHCVPANINCYSANLANDFDGNKFGCNTLPVTHAVQYQNGYVPPAPPPAATPLPTCMCGTSSMTAGSSQLCVRARRNSEGFGNYDDMFDVQICNSVGVLQDASPAHYFNEQGYGSTWNWRLGSCTSFGGTKNEAGIKYTTGRCW